VVDIIRIEEKRYGFLNDGIFRNGFIFYKLTNIIRVDGDFDKGVILYGKYG
jgi:hypothetical protein